MKNKIVVLPCSGIGKAFGEIGRQAVYEALENFRPEDVTTTCLARLMIADAETKALMNERVILTVDGCPQDCARKNVVATGKKVERALRVIEAFREHRDLKPADVLELGEAGVKLVHILAKKIRKEIVDSLRREEQQDV
jgi:uncharacterized metal-binding protein